MASGHGGCTAGEQFTVAVTITQYTSGAMATGETQGTCTGILQNWSSLATTVSTTSLAAGPAEACGFATTRENGYITDTYEWCLDMSLVSLDQQLYLPTVLKP